MPSSDAMIDMVCNQMMRGPRSGRVKASQTQKDAFKRRHRTKIVWVLERLPRYSAAVAAVTMKCLIRHGEEPVERWCKALKDCQFNGQDDPAHHLWQYLLKPHGKSTVEVYQKTLYAAKAYMEGREINSLRTAREDIFTWDDDFTVPDEYVEAYSNCCIGEGSVN